ncbi:exonuclease III [Metarhizium album ARSEF 1941]|uniref:Exonuclease III n=1 Tax=Metarhizium album (strain ARSEF 1941) TaxID=1081103 RepID=A0A0B2WIV1_METAS|nr:exonuclease III [Metarhizium album ARSEF 1941]KHN93743.1 exonuclease III [Metarhizium album ARSEF 1941]
MHIVSRFSTVAAALVAIAAAATLDRSAVANTTANATSSANTDKATANVKASAKTNTTASTDATANATSTSTGNALVLETYGPTKPNYLVPVDGPALTFNFSTAYPHPRNWIGIWRDYYGGPDHQKLVVDQLAWTWVNASQGSIHVNVSHLEPGRYKAYFLAYESYNWLARPVHVYVPGAGPLQWIPSNFTTHKVYPYQDFRADISGLLMGVKDHKTRFSIVHRHNADWVYVAKNGTLFGMPLADVSSSFIVMAHGSDNSTAALPVYVPIPPVVRRRKGKKDKSNTDKIKVLTFNLWDGGRNVNDYHRKQVKFLAELDADIVCLQECYFQDGLRLAKALGWNARQGRDVATLSRYPIVHAYRDLETGVMVRIAVEGDSGQVIVTNLHFNPYPYGPYEVCYTNSSTAYVRMREEMSRRTQGIMEFQLRLRKYRFKLRETLKIPHILAGSFNQPSHRDWGKRGRRLHCIHKQGYFMAKSKFPWSISMRNTQEIFYGDTWKDSYRQAHLHPAKFPGNTWSPTHWRHGDRLEPHDRIDYIYHRHMKTVNSQTIVVGKPKREPYHRDNEWTSDHAAVMSTLELPLSAGGHKFLTEAEKGEKLKSG